MSDIRPIIRLDHYEHLAVRALNAGEAPAEPSALADSPGDWDILAFSATGGGGGLVLLGKRRTRKSSGATTVRL